MSGFTPLQAPWLQGGGNSLGSNPMALVGEAMKIRQGMQEFNARQQLGNIFAGSPDMDTAMERARQDPLVSQYPQFMTELRNQKLLDTQLQQAQLGQANSAREAVQHSVIEAGNDPDALLPAMQRQISSLNYLPKNVQQQMLAHAQTIAENLTHGQDKMSPEERSADYTKKRAQFLVSHGMKPDEALVASGFGQPSVRDLEGVPTGVRLDPFTGKATITGAPAPTAPTAPQPAATPSPASGGAVGAPAAKAEDVAGSGVPLYPQGLKGPVTFGTTGAGTPILSGPQKVQADDVSKRFEGEERQQYAAAQQNSISYARMDAALDKLAKDGGLTVPGAAAEFRTSAGRIVNTIADLAGKPPVFDTSKIATAEQLIKETETLTGQTDNQFFGAQRVAAQTLNRVAKMVPGIENSYLGAKLILSGLKASNQRAVEQRNFKNLWLQDPAHGGNLLGAEEAFNQTHPAVRYADKTLDEFGIGADGKFNTPQDVMAMRARGLLTDGQIEKILGDQFDIHRTKHGSGP